MTYEKTRRHPSLERLENDLKQKSDLIQASRDLKMTHQNCTRNTLNEERFYVDGALVIASSLRRTEIKQILSVWSLQAFLRLLGRFREMTRGPVTDTASAQHGLDRQNTLFNTKMQRQRHRGSPLDYMIFFSGYRMHHIQRIPTDLPAYD